MREADEFRVVLAEIALHCNGLLAQKSNRHPRLPLLLSGLRLGLYVLDAPNLLLRTLIRFRSSSGSSSRRPLNFTPKESSPARPTAPSRSTCTG